MPVTTDTLWNTKRLNAIFAITALVAALSTAWMLWADYDRPWRHTQLRYFDIMAALSHFDFLGFKTPESKERHKQLQDAVSAADADLSKKTDEEKELLKARNLLGGKLAAANMSFGDLNAQIQVTEFNYNEYKTLHGAENEKTVAARKLLDEQRAQLTKFRTTKDTLEDEQRALSRKMRAFYAKRDDARKNLAAFEKGMDEAARRDKLYGAKGGELFGLVPVRDIFNAPLADFLAPRGTPGREEIKQVVLPDIRADFNFAQSYITDRCTTCHVGIDNPNLTREMFAEKLQTALRVVNEERVARGEKPLEANATPAADAKPGDAAVPTPAFADMNDDQKDKFLTGLTNTLNTYLKSTGRAPIEYGHPLLAHPNLDLYVSPDSPHPINKMGCTVCHEGNGQETDFVLAAHTPHSEEQAHEWGKKYYVKHGGVPEINFHTAQEYWERPMLLKQNTSASCAKCHTQTTDLEQREGERLPDADAIVRGEDLYITLGCINCHASEGLNDSRQVGPDLTHVASKLTEGFIQKWVNFPKDYRPSTRMPHPFRQENNLPWSKSFEDPDPILRTNTEIEAISHYLLTFSKPYTPVELPTGIQGDPKHGEELFTSIGCLACHANLEAKNPNDSAGRSFGECWIIADLVHDGASADDAAKRYKDMTHNQRVEYAVVHLTTERRDRLQRVADAEKAAAEAAGRDPDPKKQYVPGALTRFAPELGGLGTKLNPDAGNAEQATAARRWLYDWLREPRHYSSYTKMPRMFRDNYYWQERDPAGKLKKNDQDMLDVAEYLLSLRHDSFKPEPFPNDPAHEAEVVRLVRILLAGQNTDSVVAAIISDKKMDPADEFGLLTDRVVKTVAPSYGTGDAGVKAVGEIIAKQDLAGKQKLFLGSKMILHYGCYACHSIPGFEGASRPGTELSTWGRKLLAQLDFAFFDEGFAEDREKDKKLWDHLYPEGSAEFEQLIRASGGKNEHVDVSHTHASFAHYKLANPRIWDRDKLKKPYEKLKMPNFFLNEDEVHSLVTYLLSRQAPLVRPQVQIAYEATPTGKLARGRHLVAELNCIGCHSIENNSANVQQYYFKPDPASGQILFDVTNAPPNLYGEGAKIQFSWLYGFLNNVEMLRPWLKIRMPSFHLTHEQTTTLVEYFVGAAQSQSQSLAERLATVHGWESKVNSTPTWRKSWFVDLSVNYVADWLARYALRQKLVMPFDLDTKSASNGEEASKAIATGFQKVVTGSEFLQRLYNVEYPFAGMPHVQADDARYDHGKKLLLELKCLACHVAGDPFAEGTTADIKAPNFALAHRRLRPDWVKQWLLNPQWIQPGTNMPQLFADGNSAFKDFPEADRDKAQAEFGQTSGDQIQLLIDFLFDLGSRNATVVQPPAPAAPEGAKPAEKPRSAEDEFEDQGGGAKPAAEPKDDKKPATEGKKDEPKSGGDDFQP